MICIVNVLKPLNHQVYFHFAIALNPHLFLEYYLYSSNIYDSNKTFKVRYWYKVIAQLIKAMVSQHRRRVVHMRFSIYTGPVDAMLCANRKVYDSDSPATFRRAPADTLVTPRLSPSDFMETPRRPLGDRPATCSRRGKHYKVTMSVYPTCTH